MLVDLWLPVLRHGTLGLLLRSKVEKTLDLVVGPPFTQSLSLKELVKERHGGRNILFAWRNRDGLLPSRIMRRRTLAVVACARPTSRRGCPDSWRGVPYLSVGKHSLLWEGLGPSGNFW
jgi:hypothetical protein